MNNALSALLSIIGGIIGLAVLSVILSPRATSSQVVTSTGAALATVIGAAVSPVTQASGSNPFSTSVFGDSILGNNMSALSLGGSLGSGSFFG